MKATQARFSDQTIKFLLTASKQKKDTWLEKHREEYERHILNPLKNLAHHLKAELGPLARDYNFPQKGIGRMRRSAQSIANHGGGLYRDWMSYSAARPRTSRFETNPNIFLLVNPEDRKDPVLIAGGLYMPSSRQMRALREAVANDASPFEELFASKEFKRCFPGGFSDEKISSRNPKGFDPNHPKMNWIRLQAFFVWKPYTKREFASKDFAALVARDGRQILRMNRLLENAIAGKQYAPKPKTESSSLVDRFKDLERVERQMDF